MDNLKETTNRWDRYFLCFILAALVCSALTASAAPRGRTAMTTTAVYQDEGDTISTFSVTCASTTWTSLVSAASTRRNTLAMPGEGNTRSVCIAVTTTGATAACNDSVGGVYFTTNTVAQAWTDFSRSAWNCRATNGDSAFISIIKGYTSKDTGDLGWEDR